MGWDGGERERSNEVNHSPFFTTCLHRCGPGALHSPRSRDNVKYGGPACQAAFRLFKIKDHHIIEDFAAEVAWANK